jgi:dipeptidyl-peptidase-4
MRFWLAMLLAQGGGAEDRRIEGLRTRAREAVIRDEVSPRWVGNGPAFWYAVRTGPGRREYVRVDPEAGTRTAHADPAAMERELGAGERPPAPAPPPPRERSPDGRWTVFVKDHDLWLRAVRGGEELRLSEDGSADLPYSTRLWWSPDSLRLAALRLGAVRDREITLVESSPRDRLQPRTHVLRYPKPGDPLPRQALTLFDVDSRRGRPVADDLFPTPWSLDAFRWDRDGRRLTFAYNPRGHSLFRLIGVETAEGAASTILEEPCATFFDYAHKRFERFLEASGELLWMSERDGWNHLYLFDARTGGLKHRVTAGDWVVRGVDHVDEDRREIWFRAGGIRPGQDPYHVHHARVNFDGSDLVVLTEGDGTHQVAVSPDRRWLVDTWSRVDHPPVTELRRASDGKLVLVLERAEAPGVRLPERFAAKGRDGTTDIWGVLHVPSTFDPAKRYPVIEDIYAGPQGSHVPKAFRSWHGSRTLAESGFVVVQIDGMGTSHRSKAFHDVCWKNLGDSGFPDRIPWMKAAAATRPWMDLSRVGVTGVSAGGQSALRALLAHGDFYKAAVAACGCHDNRMDKIWWNELWMGWPVGSHYAEQSNVVQAHRLQGELMLIVGELDRNVDPASTMQVVDALVRADKDFDLVVVPGAGHGLGGAYGARRRRDFFVRTLLGGQAAR